MTAAALSLVVCPVCRCALLEEGNEFVCGGCMNRYPVLEGIPYLIAGDDRKGTTNELYNSIAGHYDDALPGHVVNHYRKKRVQFVVDRQTGGDLLDVGCGTGHLGAAFRDAGYNVHGTDASVGMLKVFRDRNTATVIGGRANELPFPDDRFDVVICVALLHHIVEPKAVARTIQEMYRVTKPGGLTVIWDHNPLNPYWPILMKRVPQDDGSERLIPLKEVLRALPLTAAVEVRRLGFMPDFMPSPLLSLATRLEAVAEKTPLIRELGAHNIVAARKPLR